MQNKFPVKIKIERIAKNCGNKSALDSYDDD